MLLEVENLTRQFGGGRTLTGRRPVVHAVSDISLSIDEGRTLGVVGESGCGKSTFARMLVGLDQPTSGSIRLAGHDIRGGRSADGRPLSATVQYVFQDPVSSLNPRKTIRQTLTAPMRHLLKMDAGQRERRLDELMDAVNLRPEFLDRYPHEFSGGQAQRIGIARALAAEPRILVLDEPVSALDVSVQAQVLNLLADLKRELGLTYVFISHDLSVIESISDEIAVMYFGRVVETGPGSTMFHRPRHPYTGLLLRSAPVPGQRRIHGEPKPAELPNPFDPPPGCAFAARCENARDDCRASVPPLDIATPDAADPESGKAHVACYHPLAEKPDKNAPPTP